MRQLRQSGTHPASSAAESGRTQSRFDALSRRFAAPRTSTVAPAPVVEGQLAPAFEVVDLGGMPVTLRSLLDPFRPLLLVFINPTCNSCKESLHDIGGWQRMYRDRLAIVVISTGDVEANRALTARHGIEPVLLQREREVVRAYGLTMAPGAVVVQPDGRIGRGPGYGPDAIRQLVADTLGEVVSPAPDAVLPVARGDRAPRIDRPDLNGMVVDLDAYLGAPFLLLFWDPGCPFCQRLLPKIRAFEQATTRVRLVVISEGDVDANRGLGLASLVVRDDQRAIARAFGATVTPAAVLIGAKGTVASAVAQGAQGVSAYVERCHVPVVTPTDQYPNA